MKKNTREIGCLTLVIVLPIILFLSFYIWIFVGSENFFYGLTKVSKGGIPKEVSEYKYIRDLTEADGFETTVLRANNGIIYTDSLSNILVQCVLSDSLILIVVDKWGMVQDTLMTKDVDTDKLTPVKASYMVNTFMDYPSIEGGLELKHFERSYHKNEGYWKEIKERMRLNFNGRGYDPMPTKNDFHWVGDAYFLFTKTGLSFRKSYVSEKSYRHISILYTQIYESPHYTLIGERWSDKGFDNRCNIYLVQHLD